MIAGAENVAQRHGVACQLRTDRPTQEAIMVKDAHLGHVMRIESQRDCFAKVRCERGRNVAQTLEVDTINSCRHSSDGLPSSSGGSVVNFGRRPAQCQRQSNFDPLWAEVWSEPPKLENVTALDG
jgi:hypothetical protein